MTQHQFTIRPMYIRLGRGGGEYGVISRRLHIGMSTSEYWPTGDKICQQWTWDEITFLTHYSNQYVKKPKRSEQANMKKVYEKARIKYTFVGEDTDTALVFQSGSTRPGRILVIGVVHINRSKFCKGLECVVLCAMTLYTIKNSWRYSKRVGHSPDFGLPSVEILPWSCRKRHSTILTSFTHSWACISSFQYLKYTVDKIFLGDGVDTASVCNQLQPNWKQTNAGKCFPSAHRHVIIKIHWG